LENGFLSRFRSIREERKLMRETKMDIQKSLCLIISACLVSVFLFDTGLTQTKRADQTIFLSGPVREVSWDYRSIVVKDKKFLISENTKVVDQKGNRLKISDVKNNSDVAIDAIAHPNGYVITMIVVITDRGV